MASLKRSWAATLISSRSRWSLRAVSFQLTMNPSIPAAFASSIWRRMTLASPLEYLPIKG